jgi:hypothetical protein
MVQEIHKTVCSDDTARQRDYSGRFRENNEGVEMNIIQTIALIFEGIIWLTLLFIIDVFTSLLIMLIIENYRHRLA